MKVKIKYLIIASISALVVYIFFKSKVTQELCLVLLISFIIAYSIRPIQKIMVERGISKRVAAILILSAFIIATIWGFVLIIPSIFRESLSISTSFEKIQLFIQDIYNKLRPLRNNQSMYILIDNFYSNINKMFIALLNKLISGVFKLGENLLELAVIPIIIYYFLADGQSIGNRLIVIFPSKYRIMVRKILSDIDKVLGRYILSQFLLCAIIGILSFFVLIIYKVQFPIILSILNAFFNIIPYFGPIFGALPSILVALLVSPKTAIWTGLWLYLIQQIEGNLISPKITGDSVSMHPLIVILLLIIGGKLGGFIGMVLAIPVGVVLKILYEDLNHYLF